VTSAIKFPRILVFDSENIWNPEYLTLSPVNEFALYADDDDDDGRFLACEDCGKVRALVRNT
jgi:hypothetical protein